WHPGHLEDAAEETLRTWLPAYLNEVVAGDPAAPTVKAPRSFNVTSEDGRWPEQQLPAIIIASPGVPDDIGRGDGAGNHEAVWQLEITAIVRGKNQKTARRLAQIYWAAISLSIVQRRSLGGDRYRAD